MTFLIWAAKDSLNCDYQDIIYQLKKIKQTNKQNNQQQNKTCLSTAFPRLTNTYKKQNEEKFIFSQKTSNSLTSVVSCATDSSHTSFLGSASGLVRSHMNTSLPFERAIQQTIGTIMPWSPKNNCNCFTRLGSSEKNWSTELHTYINFI